ncbi:hypothetical protein V7166_21860 [Bacillus thuringiensis]
MSIHLDVLEKLDTWEGRRVRGSQAMEDLGNLVYNHWDEITSSLFLIDRYELSEKIHREVRGGKVK